MQSNWRDNWRPRPMPYLVAVVATAAVLLARLLFEPVLQGQVPMLLFTVAVLISAYIGGLGPGLAATVLSLVFGGYLFVEPQHAFWPDTESGQARLILFLGTGGTISFLCERLHRASARSRHGERALRDSEARYRLVNQATNDVIWDLDLGNHSLCWNEAVYATFGYPLEEVPHTLDWWRDHVHPDDRDRVTRSLHAAIADPASTVWTAEYRFQHRDGHWMDVLDRGFVSRDGQGRGVRMIGSMLDLTERKRTERTLRQSEEKFRCFFERAAIGMGRMGFKDARWIDVNEVFCRMLGYSVEEMRATPWPRITHPEDVDLDMVPFRRMAAGELDSYSVEKRFLHKQGYPVWARLTLSLVCDAQGRPDYEIAVIEDITHRKQAEQELAAAKLSAEKAKAAAEDASRAKDHFLAVLSHELRTPLTPVLASVSMLQAQGGRFDADTREHLEMIRRNVEMEARLIDDLLDMTRIARGKIELERRPVEANEIVRRAVEVVRPEMQAKGQNLELDIKACGPCHVDADAGRLQQVYWNLLNNAIKFTPPGGSVRVRCRVEAGSIVTDVIDSGVGIEPAALSRIFNAFEQGERAVTRRFGGLGLGLAISRTLVELHGGSITAHSEGKGRGSRFTVRLPLASADRGTAPPRADEQSHAVRAVATNGHRLHILLVEDHADTARIMRRLLMADGHEVRTAGDVASALTLAGQDKYDLLISDLGLPDGSGLDLMRTLRLAGDPLPGIALSGYGQEEDIRRSREAGFAAHLTKPTSPDRLADTIAVVAGK